MVYSIQIANNADKPQKPCIAKFSPSESLKPL